MKNILNQLVATPVGAYVVLSLAAFQSTGLTRVFWFLGGTAVLASYGFFVNLPQWDFGKLLGVYVVLFFVIAQIVAKVRFHQSPSMPILVGGAFIVAGGLVMTFWKV